MNINRPNSLHYYAIDDRVDRASGAASTVSAAVSTTNNSGNTENFRKKAATDKAISAPLKKQIIMESSTDYRSASFTGENPVRDISVVPSSEVKVKCAAHPGLQEMPDELLLNIFGRLNFRDIFVIKNTFEAADRVVNDILGTESKRWFSRFTPLQQAKFKKIAEGTDEQNLRTWLGQFTKDEMVVIHLLENRHHRHFPELLFYTVSQLMNDCQAFKVKQLVSIEHNRCFKPTNFSEDGNHIVTLSISGQSKIHTLSPDGQWVEKTTLCHNKRLCSAEFTGDGRHVVTTSNDDQSKIHAQNSDGIWIEENSLPQDTGIKFADFSPDGRRVAINVNYNTLRIFGRGTDGAWAEEYNFFFGSDIVNYSQPSFNRDGNKLMVMTNNGSFLYCRGSNGRWEERLALVGEKSYLGQFSPNDSHITTLHHGSAKIFARDMNGNWMEQAEIDHKTWVRSADFSANSRYVVTTSLDKTYAIYYLATNGNWIKKAIIDTQTLLPATLSFDGRYLAIFANNDTVKLYGLGADGQCTEVTHIDSAQHAFFSPDGNHIFTRYQDHVSIYGLGQDGKLVLKATLNHGQSICSATISPTGRYLVTCGFDAYAKIWLLSAENEPGSPSRGFEKDLYPMQA